MSRHSLFKVIFVLFLIDFCFAENLLLQDFPFLDGKNYSCVWKQQTEEMTCTGQGNQKVAFSEEHGYDAPGSPEFWEHLGICVGLILLAGTMSGLTMGLMSLDMMNLKILKESGSPNERKYASKIIPLVDNHHLLLVTLLLANAAAMEALPVFLELIVTPPIAIILSVTMVLTFGEIIPQALCTRYGLAIGYYLHWFVWFLIALLFVIAFPIAKLLDCLIGSSHSTFFRRAELKELVKQHGTEGSASISANSDERGPLTADEVRVIRGALSMREKKCEQVYTPLDEVFSLELRTVLDQKTLDEIVAKNHSRIPIYRKHKGHIIGLILAKSLVAVNPSDKISLKSFPLINIPLATLETPLFTLLNQFSSGKSHMAVVLDPKDNVTCLGIVTLEDVVEELIQSEIYDEADLLRDRKEAMRRLQSSSFPPMSLSSASQKSSTGKVSEERQTLLQYV